MLSQPQIHRGHGDIRNGALIENSVSSVAQLKNLSEGEYGTDIGVS